MKRLFTSLTAAMVIAGGAFYLSAPPALAAAAEPVCCDGADNSRCCGDECKANADGCSACSGWRCWFF